MPVFEEFEYLLAYDQVVIAREVLAHSFKLFSNRIDKADVWSPCDELFHILYVFFCDEIDFFWLHDHFALVFKGHDHQVK